jgi:hypothetical protein
MSELKLTSVFPFEDVEYRVGATTKDGAKGMAVFYIDARAVMDRLDACGLNWCDEYTLHPDGKHVECRLTVMLPVGEPDKLTDGSVRPARTEPVTRADVGEPSEGMGDPLKGAYSDALKRAGVKFGIGRYLYGLGERWVPLDGNKRFTPEAHSVLRKFYIDKVGVGRTGDPARQDEPEAAGGASPPAAAPATNGARNTASPESMSWSKFWTAAKACGVTVEDVKDVAHGMGYPTSDLWTEPIRQEILAELARRKAVAA